jgi:hypothetical protein
VRERLPAYTTRRNEAADDHTSHLSPDLHFGHIAAADVLRAALASDAPRADIDAFTDQVLTWRELSYNWCLHTPRFDQLDALPDWIQRTMAAHAHDPRPESYTLEPSTPRRPTMPLWNAAQRQLVQAGVIHNYARMLWGKQIVRWAPTLRAGPRVDVSPQRSLRARRPRSEQRRGHHVVPRAVGSLVGQQADLGRHPPHAHVARRPEVRRGPLRAPLGPGDVALTRGGLCRGAAAALRFRHA